MQARRFTIFEGVMVLNRFLNAVISRSSDLKEYSDEISNDLCNAVVTFTYLRYRKKSYFTRVIVKSPG